MADEKILKAILNSLIEPIVYVNLEHKITFLNKEAEKKFQKWGGKKLEGNSIFACHNDNSCKQIVEITKELAGGLEEKFIYISKDEEKVYMRAVRDSAGKLMGYYERYEKMR